jgi:tetratricopeptide (TPR) repeat protein
VLSLALLLTGAVAFAQDQPAEATPTQSHQPLPVRAPDLDHLESAVAAQLRETQNLLQEILEDSESGPDSISEAYGQLGRLYHAYDFTEPAEACYLNAIRYAPRDPRWPYYLAYLYQGRGVLEKARRYYQSALELQPATLATLVHLGEVYLAQNQLSEARARLEQALEVDPACAAAQAGLGQIALSERRYPAAIELFESALAKLPEANRLHYPLALAYRGLGDQERAAQHLEQRGTVGARPPDPLIEELATLTQGERVQTLRGRMAYRAGRFPEASEAFGKAVAAKPESAAARINLGSTLARLGDRAGAQQQYLEALKLAPDNKTAHFNLATLLAQQGKTSEAIEQFEAAVQIDPQDAEAQLELAQLLRLGGRLDQALDHYTRAAELAPLSEAASLGQAATLVQLGRYREALRRLEEAHAAMPEQGRIAHGLAKLLAASPDLELRDGRRALDLALRVYEASPTVEHAQTVASALAELDRCAEAFAWLSRGRAEAEQAGQTQPAQELLQKMARYQHGPPCRDPGSLDIGTEPDTALSSEN